MITKEELLERLKAEGIEIGGNPDRMLTHYISLGLIDKPVRFGLGQGKGSVSKFDEKVIERVKQIVALKKNGLNYGQIKKHLMTSDDWLFYIKKIMEHATSEEHAISSIRRIAMLDDAQKGKFKLTIDVANHLTEIVVNELLSILTDRVVGRGVSRGALVEDVYSAIEFALPNVFHEFGFDAEDYEEYLAGKKSWKRPASMETKKSKGL